MSTNDPVRLDSRDDIAELAEVVRAAQRAVPDDAAVARIARSLQLSVSEGPEPQEPGAPTTPGGKPLLSAGAGKAIGALGAAIVLGATGWALLQPKPELPRATIVRPLPTLSAPVVPTPEGSSLVVVPSVPFSDPSARATVNRPSAPSIPSELELIEKAAQAMHSDPALVLALTERHRRLYRNGALSEEREALTIEALAALGRSGDANARASSFRAKYPNSAYGRRIERALGAGADSASVEPR